MIKPWHPLDSIPPAVAKEPTPARVEQRRRYALTLCKNAGNASSWRMADRLAKAWDCGGCVDLGIAAPE